jgi:lysophospholipase L1-like esterase
VSVLIFSSCQANSNNQSSQEITSGAATIMAATGSQQNGVLLMTPSLLDTLPPVQTPEGSVSQAITAIPTIKCPATILFYGGSRLGNMGISFVENIKALINPCFNLISAAFWAHTAQWGSAHLQKEVVLKDPDVVALWWGANDFNGCNGTTDPNTDLPDNAKFNGRLKTYLSAMKSMIETLAGLGKPVYVFDEPRVNGGKLPWGIEDSNGNVTDYDHNHLCAWDWVSDAVAKSQKQLVADERGAGYKVVLVDVWQLYIDEGKLPEMYSTDVVHPGSAGREKIAELFLQVFQANSQP